MSSDIVLGIVHKLKSLYVTHTDTKRGKKPHNFEKLKLAICAMSISKVKSTKSHTS